MTTQRDEAPTRTTDGADEVGPEAEGAGPQPEAALSPAAGGGAGSGTPFPARGWRWCSRAWPSPRRCCPAAPCSRAWCAASPPPSATGSGWPGPGCGGHSPTATSGRCGRVPGGCSPSRRRPRCRCGGAWDCGGRPSSATSWTRPRPTLCSCRCCCWPRRRCSPGWSPCPGRCAESTAGSSGRLQRWMGPRATRPGWAAVVAATWLVVSGLLLNGLAELADRGFSVRNTAMAEGVEQPTSGLVAGVTRIAGVLGFPRPSGADHHRHRPLGRGHRRCLERVRGDWS